MTVTVTAHANSLRLPLKASDDSIMQDSDSDDYQTWIIGKRWEASKGP